MRIRSRILVFSLAGVLMACQQQPATPLETFKTYTKAIKKKDTAAMKVMLSDATIKMDEQEAKAQGIPLDDVLSRETLFIASQKSVEYRDEKINGDKATLQVKNSFGSWETVPFVREDGVWKIDKAGHANQMMKDIFNKQKGAFGSVDVDDAVVGDDMLKAMPEETLKETPEETVKEAPKEMPEETPRELPKE